MDRKIVAALNSGDAAAGMRDAKALATALQRKHPGAAASLREGLDELFTVAWLGITGTLAKSLISINPIESMISIARTTNRNVKRWRDGQMVLWWTAAGMLNAARSSRRLKGYKQMPQLISALYQHAYPTPPVHTRLSGPRRNLRRDRHRSSTRPVTFGNLRAVIPSATGQIRGGKLSCILTLHPTAAR